MPFHLEFVPLSHPGDIPPLMDRWDSLCPHDVDRYFDRFAEVVRPFLLVPGLKLPPAQLRARDRALRRHAAAQRLDQRSSS